MSMAIPKPLLTISVLFILMITGILSGCSSPQRIQDPTILPELRGYIRPKKTVYQVNEPIGVSYWLANVSENPIREKVLDGSKDDDIAFQGYSFNAFDQNDPNKHLTLSKVTPPFNGLLTLAPGEEKLFSQNSFTASSPGAYLLSFKLRWRDEKKIAFKPITIRIVSPKKVEVRVDADLQQAISQLISEDYLVHSQARQKIIAMGARAVPFLIQSLNSDNSRLSFEAMHTLIAMKQTAVPALLVAARHSDRQTRFRAIYALGQIGDERALSVMQRALLTDPDQEIRSIVLRSIAENLADPIAIPMLIEALADVALEIRGLAIQALQKRTGRNFEFYASDSVNNRQKAIDKWKSWWRSTHPEAFK